MLRTQIAWLQRQLFGPGKSEKLDRAQLLLKLAELEKLTASAETPTQTITYERTSAPREKRPLPAENFAKLPVREVIELVPAVVQAQPEAYERIGEERTFEVDVVPPKLFKREIVRPKFQRREAREQPPVVAPAPARPVQGGYASAGLLAWVALSKYVDHAPLYRLEQMSARWGASISRQTMTWTMPLPRLERMTSVSGRLRSSSMRATLTRRCVCRAVTRCTSGRAACPAAAGRAVPGATSGGGRLARIASCLRAARSRTMAVMGIAWFQRGRAPPSPRSAP